MDERVRELQRALALDPHDQELVDQLMLEARRSGAHVMVPAGFRRESRGVLFEGDLGGENGEHQMAPDGTWVAVEESVPFVIHRRARWAPVWRCACGYFGTVRPRRSTSPSCPRARVASPASASEGPGPLRHEVIEQAGAGGSLPPAPARLGPGL